jgi:hypothetical protein
MRSSEPTAEKFTETLFSTAVGIGAGEFDDTGYVLAGALNFSCHTYGDQSMFPEFRKTWKYRIDGI